MLRTCPVKVTRHEVHVIRQEILPSARYALHQRLAAQFAFRNSTSRATRVTSEAKEFRLVHHGIHGILELQDFAFGFGRDLLRQIAVGHGGGHFGDVTDLRGQVRGHQVHVIRQILPCARYAFHLGLSAQLAFRAHFAGHARRFKGEGGKPAHHGVHRFGRTQEFPLERAPFGFLGDRLGKIAVGNGADDAGLVFRGRPDQIVD